MLSVKTKSVCWKAKQIFRLVPIVTVVAVVVRMWRRARRSAAPEAVPRAGVHQDDRLPPRLDPRRGRGDPATRRSRHAFRVDTTSDAGRFTTRSLRRYDVVIFLSTTGTPIKDARQRAALTSYIRRGGGYLGVHAASDTRGDWPWYERLVGARFKRHDPGITRRAVEIVDGATAATRGLPSPVGAHRRVVRVPLSARQRTCSPASTSRVRWPGATATMAAARCTPQWAIPRSPTPSLASCATCWGRSRWPPAARGSTVRLEHLARACVIAGAGVQRLRRQRGA